MSAKCQKWASGDVGDAPLCAVSEHGRCARPAHYELTAEILAAVMSQFKLP
jgi:hypothetical protein